MAKELLQFSKGRLEEFLTYLDDLRRSGVTNMFGATSYLEAEFGLTSADARAVLAHWMRTFEDRRRR